MFIKTFLLVLTSTIYFQSFFTYPVYRELSSLNYKIYYINYISNISNSVIKFLNIYNKISILP